MKKNYDKILTLEIKEKIIRDYVYNFLSIREIAKKYNINSKEYIRKKLLNDYIRSTSESAIIAHKKFPESFKHSDLTKDKIRYARLKYMKEHPEQTAWRQKNKSYPESCFEKILKENGISDRFLIYREYCVFPYYIDFAFIDLKIAVEIDGSQHMEKERKEHDERKDELLKDKGWRIIRFTANDVLKNTKFVIKELMTFLENNKKYEKVGILESPKSLYIKKERGNDGLTDLERERAFKQRKVIERPTKEQLSVMIETDSFKSIGRKYGVCDKTIVKWCKYYGLPFRKRDLK